MHKLLSTSEFAQAIGVSESSVRRMADRGQVEVQRTPGGHRKIPSTDAIRYMRERGIQPNNPSLFGMSVSETDASPEGFYQAVVSGQSDKAVQIVQSLYFQGWSSCKIFDGPVHETMIKIGEAYPENKRAIFSEHRAVSICTRALMLLRSLMPLSSATDAKAICAAPFGDPYILPSLMCSIVLHEAGFDEIDLGPNTPLDVLIDAVAAESPRLVSISITTAINSRSAISELRRLNEVAEANGCTVVIGGQNANMIDLPSVVHGRSMSDLKMLGESLLKESH